MSYSCGACGAQAPRSVGRCPTCGEWGTVAEEAAPGARQRALGAVPAVTRLDETSFLVATGGPVLYHDMAWVRRHIPDDARATVVDVSNAHAVGPDR